MSTKVTQRVNEMAGLGLGPAAASHPRFQFFGPLGWGPSREHALGGAADCGGLAVWVHRFQPLLSQPGLASQILPAPPGPAPRDTPAVRGGVSARARARQEPRPPPEKRYLEEEGSLPHPPREKGVRLGGDACRSRLIHAFVHSRILSPRCVFIHSLTNS